MDLRTSAQPFISLVKAVHMDDSKAEGCSAGAIPAIRRHKADFIRLGPKGIAGNSVDLRAWFVDADSVDRENVVEGCAEVRRGHGGGEHGGRTVGQDAGSGAR